MRRWEKDGRGGSRVLLGTYVIEFEDRRIERETKRRKRMRRGFRSLGHRPSPSSALDLFGAIERDAFLSHSHRGPYLAEVGARQKATWTLGWLVGDGSVIGSKRLVDWKRSPVRTEIEPGFETDRTRIRKERRPPGLTRSARLEKIPSPGRARGSIGRRGRRVGWKHDPSTVGCENIFDLGPRPSSSRDSKRRWCNRSRPRRHMFRSVEIDRRRGSRTPSVRSDVDGPFHGCDSVSRDDPWSDGRRERPREANHTTKISPTQPYRRSGHEAWTNGWEGEHGRMDHGPRQRERDGRHAWICLCIRGTCSILRGRKGWVSLRFLRSKDRTGWEEQRNGGVVGSTPTHRQPADGIGIPSIPSRSLSSHPSTRKHKPCMLRQHCRLCRKSHDLHHRRKMRPFPHCVEDDRGVYVVIDAFSAGKIGVLSFPLSNRIHPKPLPTSMGPPVACVFCTCLMASLCICRSIARITSAAAACLVPAGYLFVFPCERFFFCVRPLLGHALVHGQFFPFFFEPSNDSLFGQTRDIGDAANHFVVWKPIFLKHILQRFQRGDVDVLVFATDVPWRQRSAVGRAPGRRSSHAFACGCWLVPSCACICFFFAVNGAQVVGTRLVVLHPRQHRVSRKAALLGQLLHAPSTTSTRQRALQTRLLRRREQWRRRGRRTGDRTSRPHAAFRRPMQRKRRTNVSNARPRRTWLRAAPCKRSKWRMERRTTDVQATCQTTTVVIWCTWKQNDGDVPLTLHSNGSAWRMKRTAKQKQGIYMKNWIRWRR